MSKMEAAKIFNVIIFGDGGVGKSALTLQFVEQKYVEYYDPTLEDSYRKQVVIDSKACILDILDTAGQEEYSAMRDTYAKTGDGFILVFALNDRQSFDSISKYREMICRAKDTRDVSRALGAYGGSAAKWRKIVGSSGLSARERKDDYVKAGLTFKVAMIVVGNKADLTSRAVPKEAIDSLSSALNVPYLETSAKTRLRVDHIFHEVTRQIRRFEDSERAGVDRGHDKKKCCVM